MIINKVLIPIEYRNSKHVPMILSVVSQNLRYCLSHYCNIVIPLINFVVVQFLLNK